MIVRVFYFTTNEEAHSHLRQEAGRRRNRERCGEMEEGEKWELREVVKRDEKNRKSERNTNEYKGVQMNTREYKAGER